MKHVSLLFFIFTISCSSQNNFVARNLANLNSYDGSIKSNLNPLQKIEDVNKNSEPEEFVRLTNARILIADYDLIRKDFKFLRNSWEFVPSGKNCEVCFAVEFEFRSKTMQRIIGFVFQDSMKKIVKAFEERAAELYTEPT